MHTHKQAYESEHSMPHTLHPRTHARKHMHTYTHKQAYESEHSIPYTKPKWLVPSTLVKHLLPSEEIFDQYQSRPGRRLH